MSLPRTGPSPSASSVSRWLALFEGLGVEPYWTGEYAKEDAIGYALRARNLGAERFELSENAARIREGTTPGGRRIRMRQIIPSLFLVLLIINGLVAQSIGEQKGAELDSGATGPQVASHTSFAGFAPAIRATETPTASPTDTPEPTKTPEETPTPKETPTPTPTPS